MGAHGLLEVAAELCDQLSRLKFSAPVAYVYNPLHYARVPFETYVRRYARRGAEALLLGMNPGPFGMVQTGVPFGEVAAVRRFLRIEAEITGPRRFHPKRPVQGFACTRSEVSGRRLWGWAEGRFGTAERFFERAFVWNYCPLAFLEDSGRNRTPDKLQSAERAALFGACDAALEAAVQWLRPQALVGIGAFAEQCFRRVAGPNSASKIGQMLHPSPASPKANRGWEQQAEKDLEALGFKWW